MTKKTLIELMLENDVVWQAQATHACQDKNMKLSFYTEKPFRISGASEWHPKSYMRNSRIDLPELCRNWHQTIVTKDQYLTAQAAHRAKRNVVEQVTAEKTPEKRTIEAIIANIKECDEKITHHSAELATYTEGRDKFVGELNDLLAKVGMKVVDVERAVVADNGGWPDYCDENGIVVDWDRIPTGSKVECVQSKGSWFAAGDVVDVLVDSCGDKGPYSIGRSLSSYTGIRNGTYKFRPIK